MLISMASFSDHLQQGQRKVFITGQGQATLNPEHHSINVWVADNFTTADIIILSVICNSYSTSMRFVSDL